jgi:2-keto-4-pentenoate hydratase/2-oxohepta-3-ene-1,7-dioic acid hydratase in catechol pathway
MLMPSIQVRNAEGTFPVEVGRIFCLTTNYRKHAREMGGTGEEKPSMFLKPWTALLPLKEGEEGEVPIPSCGRELHHEVELVLACLDGKEWAFGIGLDLTLRDVQKELKAKGKPWLLAKGFDASAPVSEFLHASLVPEPEALEISLEVNGTLRQKGTPREMTIGLKDIPQFLSEFSSPRPGDLVFTGTPEGVGPLMPGDLCRAEMSIGGEKAVSLLVRIA